jgi:hypothetical protein
MDAADMEWDYRGQPEMSSLKLAFAKSGDMEIELIEWVCGKTPHKEFLDAGREGMHPMNPDHIHEELELMGPDFASYNFEWLCQCPRWRDHYYASDQTPHYEYMKTVLKILTWQDGDDGSNTRWVLKCPQHPEQLTVLHKVFPDATIAVTHRHQAINYVHDETVKGMNEGKDVHTLMSEISLRQQ